MAELPAAVFALIVHAALAEVAGCAAGDACDQDAVAFLVVLHFLANVFNDANAFVAKRAALFDCGDIALDVASAAR